MIIKRQKEFGRVNSLSQLNERYGNAIKKRFENIQNPIKRVKEEVKLHDKLIEGRMEGKSGRALMERINQKGRLNKGNATTHLLSGKRAPKEIMRFRNR